MAVSVPSPTQFWILTGGAAKGPFSAPQIQVKLNTGEVTWGTKICPVGETQWRPLHRTPGLIPDASRPLGATSAAPVRTSSAPPLKASPVQPVNPRRARLVRQAGIGAGLLVLLVIGFFAIRSAFNDSFEGFERGYCDTILRYHDRPYEGAKWTQLKESDSFTELVTLGNTTASELYRVAGWDDNNLWIANLTGQVFQLRDGHWQFAAKPDNSGYPRLRVVDQNTLLLAGGLNGAQLYRLTPGNVTDLGATDPLIEGEIFPADRDLIFTFRSGYNSDPIRFSENTRTVMKADLYKESFVQKKDSTAIKEHPVNQLRHVRMVRPGLAYGLSASHYGKKKLARFENGVWVETTDLPEKDINDLWLSGTADSPHTVLVGKNGWVYVQPATGTGAERMLAIPPDTSVLNLLKVWGTSPDKFWVMDDHGTVWELNRSESRIVVRGLRREDVTFRDAWVSPTGAVYAITTKHLYRLD